MRHQGVSRGLVEIGLISSIQGWSLKFVQPTLGDPADLGNLVACEGQYFLVHRHSQANPPIPLSGLMFAEMDNQQMKMSGRLTEYCEAGDVLTGSSRSCQEQVRQQMAMLIDFGAYNPEDTLDYAIEMHGIHAGGLRLQTQGADRQPVCRPLASSVKSADVCCSRISIPNSRIAPWSKAASPTPPASLCQT